MINAHFAQLLLTAARNPSWLLLRVGVHVQVPLWLRSTLGVVLPPWRGRSHFRSVYVVTYGRSGSTLLTGYLSRLPGFDIRGENYLFPLPLADAEARLADASALRYGNRANQQSPWYGSHLFSMVRWQRDVLRALLNQLYPFQAIPKTIGFKEIRWWYRMDESDYEQKLKWLVSVRSPGAVIFLTRDLDRTMASAWWAKQSEQERMKSRGRLEAFEQLIKCYSDAHPDHAIHITYEDFAAGPAEAERLCRMLGVKFDERVYRQTLATRYSYSATSDTPSEP